MNSNSFSILHPDPLSSMASPKTYNFDRLYCLEMMMEEGREEKREGEVGRESYIHTRHTHTLPSLPPDPPCPSQLLTSHTRSPHPPRASSSPPRPPAPRA